LRGWFERQETVMEESFLYESFCVYIGRCWQRRRNKNPKTLNTDHSPKSFISGERNSGLHSTPSNYSSFYGISKASIREVVCK